MYRTQLIRTYLYFRGCLTRTGVQRTRPKSPPSHWDPEIATIQRREAVHTVLQVIRRTLGLRVALVTKLCEGKFVACAVLDEAGYGLEAGDDLEVAATYCGAVCHADGEAPAPLIINRASTDPRFRDHPALKRFGVESYIAVPLFRPDGSLLGTLCALDNRPAQLAPEDLNLLRLFSQLVTYELQTADELELLRRTEQFRSEVIGSLSHDLRNPASVIQMTTQNLRRSTAIGDLLPFLSLIEQSADRLNRMIRDLMDFTQSRLGSPFPLQKGAADLHDLCLRAVREHQALYPDREIRFELDGDGQGECDADRVLQVLSNLIGNALLYSPEDTAVEVRVRDADGGIVLEVFNQGPPIPPDLLPVIVQPFVRGGRKAAGMGLGLFIVDQIVRAHGGTLRVESDAEVGTTFRVTLPC